LGLLNPMGNKSIIYLVVFLVLIILSYNYRWSLVQRYYCVKDEKAARKVGLIAALLFIIVPFMWTIPPMVARMLIPDLDNPDYSYAVLCVKILPVGLMGVMLSGMLAATMSTISAEYNVLSSVFTVDIYKRWLNQTASEKATLFVARLSTLVLCLIVTVLAIIIAHLGKGLFDIMVAVFGMILPPIAIPVLWGILFPRPYAKSAIIAITLGLIISATVTTLFNVIPQLKLSADNMFILSTLVGSVPTLVVMLLGTFIEKPPVQEREKVDGFFSKLRKPYEPTGEVIEKVPSPFPIVGLSSLCIGLLLVGSIFFAKSSLHIGINLGMGLCLVIIGAILFIKSRRPA